MSSDIPKSEFTHVDSTPNPHFFVQSLDRQNATAARERYTRLIYAVDAAEEHGTITAVAAHQWRTYMEAAVPDGRFFTAMTRFATIGTKPC